VIILNGALAVLASTRRRHCQPRGWKGRSAPAATWRWRPAISIYW